jgi:PilZ domain.
VAVRIERVEREFILGTAIQTKTEARLRAAGRSVACRVSAADRNSVSFSSSDALPRFANREIVSVRFDFRGQGVAFDAPVIGSSSLELTLGLPESMYRSLSRRGSRVCPPEGLTVDFMLPDASLSLDCPECDEWVDVALPELREGLDSSNLSALVDSFKAKAKSMASEGRVVMYKDREPADAAEEMAARMGRVLYLPSALGSLPLSDPYPSGRIITASMAGEYERSASGPIEAESIGVSKLSSYLRGRSASGLSSALWCPVIYYRYTVGMILMANGPDRPQALDFRAVDLAWEFSRVLAFFLKRYGYFSKTDTKADVAPRRGGIIDASSSGLLVAIPSGAPAIESGSTLKLRLGLGGRGIICSGKVARRYSEGGTSYCGVAFLGLSAQERGFLATGLYGSQEGELSMEGGA